MSYCEIIGEMVEIEDEDFNEVKIDEEYEELREYEKTYWDCHQTWQSQFYILVTS